MDEYYSSENQGKVVDIQDFTITEEKKMHSIVKSRKNWSAPRSMEYKSTGGKI